MLHLQKRKNAFIQLADPHLDCPSRLCDGWLILYGTPASPQPVPVYFTCSNKTVGCTQATIFSKRESLCNVCAKKILLRDVITTGWDNNWVHFDCAHRSVPPPNVFASCLRCKKNIANFEDSAPSRIGTMDGFVHLACKKRIFSSVESDASTANSQESM